MCRTQLCTKQPGYIKDYDWYLFYVHLGNFTLHSEQKTKQKNMYFSDEEKNIF